VERSLIPSSTVPRSSELVAATDLRDNERRTVAKLAKEETRPVGVREDAHIIL
jgi:hypothetical protein